MNEGNWTGEPFRTFRLPLQPSQRLSGPTGSHSQFTVLDEDALGELLSLLQDLLVVDVGHGRDEALQQQQDVAQAQRAQPAQHSLPPLLPRQRGRPPLSAGGGRRNKNEGGTTAGFICFIVVVVVVPNVGPRTSLLNESQFH